MLPFVVPIMRVEMRRFPLRQLLPIATRSCLASSLAASSLVASFASSRASLSSMVSPGFTCHGEKGIRYRFVCPLGTQIRGKKPTVWLAVDAANAAAEYVAKGLPDDTESPADALLAFKHELKMQRLFEKDPMIRTLVDFIPDSEPGGPMMILEVFTDSLWEARNARPFTATEIKWIMKGVLLGIYTVHMRGWFILVGVKY